VSADKSVMRVDVRIRDASARDADAIAGIYNHYVRESVATFDTVPKDASERVEWLAEHGPAYPVLVAEIGGRVVGWGSLGPYAQRPAWYPTVELSLYVDPVHRGEGVGRMLMTALLERASEAGHHAVIGQIVAGNSASIALAEAAGFRHVGVLGEVGEKFGERLDVVLMQRLLEDSES